MVTIFTPVHKLNQGLKVLANSIKNQTNQNFEWIILLNGEAEGEYDSLMDLIDVRDSEKAFAVRVDSISTTGSVGLLKARCCSMAIGDILVEADYDDALTEDCIDKITKAFEQNSDIQFVYSNCVELLPNGGYNLYSPAYGWKSKPFTNELEQQIAFPALPQYLRRIEWSPNHVRAFRKSAYHQVGGYNEDMALGDDHDLMCRFFIEFGQKGFHHINECLYIYNFHSDNTSGQNNRVNEVQAQVDINYCNHAEKMWLRWAKDEGLLSLDLGGRFNCPNGYKSVDLLDADYQMDLSDTWYHFEDNSVGVIRAYHIIEHLQDQVDFFNEAYRVLAPGGLLLIEVPSSNGMGAFSDPTHKSFFNLMTFEYYTNEEKARFIRPKYNGRFQKSRVVEYNWNTEFGKVPIVSAQLICLKGWYSENYCGELKI